MLRDGLFDSTSQPIEADFDLGKSRQSLHRKLNSPLQPSRSRSVFANRSSGLLLQYSGKELGQQMLPTLAT